MNITAESYGHATILNLKGEFVEDALAAVRKAVDHTLEGAGVVDVIFNLEEVPFLDSAAMDALKQWEYEPMRINGKPVKAIFTVTVRFSLKS